MDLPRGIACVGWVCSDTFVSRSFGGMCVRCLALWLLLCLGASACGGGGGGGAGGPSAPSTPTPSNQLSVALSSSGSTLTVDDTATLRTLNFSATISGIATTPIVPNVTFDDTVILAATTTQTANGYTITAQTRERLPIGTSSGAIRFRLCQEAACTNVYPGTERVHSVSLTVRLGEWSTYQRGRTHAGYIPVRLDPAKFAKVWERTFVDAGNRGDHATGENKVFFTAFNKLYALDATTGSTLWTSPVPEGASWPGAPGYESGYVYVANQLPIEGPVSTGAAAVRKYQAGTGATADDFLFRGRGPYAAPTFYDNTIYFVGNGLYTYTYVPTGSTWTASPSIGASEPRQTPALDATNAYYLSSTGVVIVDRKTGALIDAVPAPSGTGIGWVAPVLTEAGYVLSTDQRDWSRLVAINPTTRAVVWRGPSVGIQPVAAGNTIYAWIEVSPSQAGIGAIDVATGSVMWTWTSPSGGASIDSSMFVTDNLLIVSAGSMLHAIDRTTHQTVWTYPAYGKLVVSSDLVLYALQVDPGTTDIRLTAIKLN